MSSPRTMLVAPLLFMLIAHGNGLSMHRATDPEVNNSRSLRLSERIAPEVARLFRSQAVVNVIDMGANAGGFGANDHETTSRIVQDPYAEIYLQPNVNAYLVQPNPKAMDVLNATMRAVEWQVENPPFHLINVAVGQDAATNETATFYTIKDELMTDKPEIQASKPWLTTHVASLIKSRVASFLKDAGVTEDEVDDYVQEVDVDKITPAAFLNMCWLYPSSVDILRTNAEGADADIIKGFLSVPGFRPKVIIFHVGTEMGKNWFHKGALDYTDMVKVIEALTSMGYKTNCYYRGSMWYCPHDAMATPMR